MGMMRSNFSMHFLFFLQNLISTVVVVALGLCRAVSVEKLNWKLIRVWLPVNVIFTGMLVSGMYRYAMNHSFASTLI